MSMRISSDRDGRDRVQEEPARRAVQRERARRSARSHRRPASSAPGRRRAVYSTPARRPVSDAIAQSTIAAITQPSQSWYASSEIASQTPKTMRSDRADADRDGARLARRRLSLAVCAGGRSVRRGDERIQNSTTRSDERERAEEVEREDPVVELHDPRLGIRRRQRKRRRDVCVARMRRVLTLLRVVHLLSATVWVGGTIALVFVGVPAIRKLEGEARATAMRTLGRRWRPLGWGAMAVAILSGLWLTDEHGGFNREAARQRLRPHADRQVGARRRSCASAPSSTTSCSGRGCSASCATAHRRRRPPAAGSSSWAGSRSC